MPDDEVTQIGVDGIRISASAAADQASFDGEPLSATIDPDTQIDSDGSRQPIPEGGADDDAPVDEGPEGTQIAPDGERRPPEDAAQDNEGIDDDGPSLAELKSRARELGIQGRSSMSRDDLTDAVSRAEAEADGGETGGVAEEGTEA